MKLMVTVVKSKSQVIFNVFVDGLYAWARHGLEPKFPGRQRRGYFTQLDHIVFWTIVKALAAVLRVKWPFSKYV